MNAKLQKKLESVKRDSTNTLILSSNAPVFNMINKKNIPASHDAGINTNLSTIHCSPLSGETGDKGTNNSVKRRQKSVLFMLSVRILLNK